MKRGKQKRFLVCMLLATMVITACGKKDNTDIENKKETTIKETQESTIAEEDGSFPSENQMTKDIDSFGANVICLENGEYTLKTKSIKIDKAKKDTEQYLVYCTATQESDMFKANNSYVMTYNYYDIGGWVLDECYVEKVDMIPKKTISEEDAKSYADNGYNFGVLKKLDLEKVSDTEYIYHYVGKYEYTYMDDIYNIDVSCEYDNENGWCVYSDVNSSYHDWSKMYGTWYGENPDDSSMTYTIVVKEVNEVAEDMGELIYDVTFATDDKKFKDFLGKKGKLTLKNCTSQIMYGVSDLKNFESYERFYEAEGIEYESKTEELYTYTYHDFYSFSDEEFTASLELCWGKEVGMRTVSFGDGRASYDAFLKKKD